MKKSIIALAVGTILAASSFTASAALTTLDTLSITQGAGGFAEPLPGNGSWFAMEALGPGGWVYTGIGGVGGTTTSPDILLNGTAQFAEAENVDTNVDPSSVANIDNPWTFFGSTGQHGSTGITATGADSIDMSGWYVSWNNVPLIDMGAAGVTAVSCTVGGVAAACTDGAAYTLDYATAVPATSPAFPNVAYQLHLEGFVSTVPVPAAVWLFGSGLLGLVGIARRRKAA